MSVINFEDYHAPKQQAVPCIVSFIGFELKTPEGKTTQLNLNIEIQNGDFQGAIDAVREYGGAYLPSQDGGKTFWFLPWPCAAVRISPVQK